MGSRARSAAAITPRCGAREDLRHDRGSLHPLVLTSLANCQMRKAEAEEKCGGRFRDHRVRPFLEVWRENRALPSGEMQCGGLLAGLKPSALALGIHSNSVSREPFAEFLFLDCAGDMPVRIPTVVHDSLLGGHREDCA